MRGVAAGEVDAVVSAGSTGAMLAASLLHIRRLPGVRRPAIAVVIPARRGPTVLIDAGANADARPEDLVQFAHMGVVFAHEILGVDDPVVRLLSIGEEDEKGNQLTLDANALLRASSLRFGGNTESRSLLEGDSDVVVTDGFTGNVALKTLEGTIRSVLDVLREEVSSSARGTNRRASDPPVGQAHSQDVRPRYLRGRLSARPARPRRDRARLQLAHRDRERDPACRARCRALRRASGWKSALAC